MVPKPVRRKNQRDQFDQCENNEVHNEDKDINVKPPKPLTVTNTGMASQWKKWKQQWGWYYVASSLQTKSNTVQVASFMSILGPDVIDIYNSFELADSDVNIEDLIEKFDIFFIGKTNVVYERFVFNKIIQDSCSSFDDFYTTLVNQAANCRFEPLKDSLIRDRIVFGIYDSKLREKLLSTDKLTLEDTIRICRAHEQAKKHVAEMSSDNCSQLVNMVTNKYPRPNKIESKAKHKESCFDCTRCGSQHSRGECPAFNKVCNTCFARGHFAKMCKSQTKTFRARPEVNTVVNDGNPIDVTLQVDTLLDPISHRDWIEPLILPRNKTVDFKLDTGAQCNVIPQNIAIECGLRVVSSSTASLVSFNNLSTPVLGETLCPVITRKSIRETVLFVIVPEGHQAIMGRVTCEALGFIKRMAGVDKCSMNELFDGIGCLTSFEYDIDLIDNPQFKIHPPRRIPHPIREAVKTELDQMVKNNIIISITEPTPCVSPMVVIKQKDKIRICIDPTDLNKNVKRRHYPLSTIEDISARLQGSKFFTILDCRKGFWQIKVTERSSRLLTFSTPWGRYSCLRLPFGLVSAPEIFQQIMSDLLRGMKNVECSMDDILIHHETENGLEKVTNEIMSKLNEAGRTLNREKCLFTKKSVKFLGHTVSDKGLEIDPDKVSAIARLKEPTCVTELQRFLGCITYLAKFIPGVSEDTQPLRKLIENGTVWLWEKKHLQAFETLKTKLQNSPVLHYYDPKSPVTLSVDASSYACGATLMQNGHPIAYSSKALTQSQQNYSQLEKETYAILAACKKFHEYVWGCKDLIVESDHKPLEVIFKKPICQAPVRIQRMYLEILPYRPKVIYKRGSELYLADTLSRDCLNTNEHEEPYSYEIQIVIPMSKDNVSRVKSGIDQSNELSNLKKVILDGWPEDISTLDASLKRYVTFKEELCCYDGLLFKANRLIIPNEMRAEILRDLHRSHKGLQSSLATARDYVFWIGIERDIERYVQNCKVCNKYQRDKPQDIILEQDVPSRPWKFIGADLFRYASKDYLIVADSYSGYFECDILKNACSFTVIEKMKRMFATHGIPDELRTDGGPCFESREFNTFVLEWKFDHRVSSPHFPRSNGLSERYVQEGKNLVMKCLDDKSDLHLALLHHRNTPRGNLGSPVQRLMSRRTKTLLPTTRNHLLPAIVKNVPEKLNKIKRREKMIADRGKRTPDFFTVGENVFFRLKKKLWVPAVVVKVGPEPRSYVVRLQNGQAYRRNSWFLRKDKSYTSTTQVNPSSSESLHETTNPRRSSRVRTPAKVFDL